MQCPDYFLLWLIAGIFGVLIGYQIALRLKFEIDSKKLIHASGTIIPLSLSMLFFVLKYTLGATYALYPIMRENMLLISVDLVLSGLISGIFLGRFICVLRKYITQ